jgi:ribosomal protein S18 acetylase RimI-like enzyme
MSHEPVFIRTATLKDLQTVQALLTATWHSTYDALYGADKVSEITSLWHSVEALQRNLSKPVSEFIVADTGSEILGMAFASQKEKTVHLHQLYVAPNAQGRGIGGELLHEIFNCFENAESVELEVDPANTKAIVFYQTFGFERIGSTDNCGKANSAIKADIYSLNLEH